MACLRILVALTILVAWASSSQVGIFTYEMTPYAITQNLNRAWELCPANTTDQNKYQSVLEEARSCYNNVIKSNKSICHSLEEKIQRCSQTLVDFFVDCFPEKARYLPAAIAKGVTSLVEAFCTSSGELLLEALNPCLYEYISFEENTPGKEECSKKVFGPKLQKFNVEIPSKTEVCQIFEDLGNCWQEHVNATCASSASKEYFSKFYNAGLTACK